MILVAGLLTAATWLLLPAATPTKLQRLQAVPSRRRSRTNWRWALLLLPLGAMAVDPWVGGWLLTGLVLASAAAWVARRQLATAALQRAESETSAAATALAGLLRAGQLPRQALSLAAQDHSVLAAAATAARLGGDVPKALTESGKHPGREGLKRLGTAWQVSEQTGAALSDVLLEVSEALRAERRVLAIIKSELASARASSRIMAGLPLVALVLGLFGGANPFQFLFGTRPGQLLCLVAAALVAVGLVWSERISEYRGGHK